MPAMIVKHSHLPGCHAWEIGKWVAKKIEEEKDVTYKTSFNQMVFAYAPGANRELIRDVRRVVTMIQAGVTQQLALEGHIDQMNREKPMQIDLFAHAPAKKEYVRTI